MASEQETVLDILREWRETADRCEKAEDNICPMYCLLDIARMTREDADRIEAAWKRFLERYGKHEKQENNDECPF